MPGKSGANLYLLPGYHVLLKRDAIGGVEQPLRDLGTVKELTPNFSSQEVKLYDSRSGVKNLVDEALIQKDENYDLSLNNMSLENQALFHSADAPEAYTQSSGAAAGVEHEVIAGHLLKLLDGSGNPIYNLTSVDYLTNENRYAITAVSVGGKEFTITGDHVTELNLAGKKLLVSNCTGMTPTTQLLTIVSATLDGADTDVVVSEAITGATAAGTIARAYVKDTDWEEVDLRTGTIRIIDGGDIEDGTYLIDYTKAAVSGDRIIKPSTSGSQIKGEAWLVMGSNNNADIFIRHCRVSIVPTGQSGSAEEHGALSFRLAVLTDLSEAIPAGELVHSKGDVPDLS